MRALNSYRRGTGRLASFVSAALIALLALAPTGAEAAPFSLKATSSNDIATSSCEFTVTRVNRDNTGPWTVTARVTLKAAEVKPSFFSPRKVATLYAFCDIYPNGSTGPNTVHIEKFNNGSTAYKSKYVTAILADNYTVCTYTQYVLKNGTIGATPETCNPAPPS
jgi:hypothetical protein